MRTFQKIYDAIGEAYKVVVDRDSSGLDTQIIGNPPFPKVPGAVTCQRIFSSGKPSVFYYKDVAGNVLATQTFSTFTDDEITDTWS